MAGAGLANILAIISLLENLWNTYPNEILLLCIVVLWFWVWRPYASYKRECKRTRDAIAAESRRDFDRRIDNLSGDDYFGRYFHRLQSALDRTAALIGDARDGESASSAGEGWRPPRGLTGPAYFAVLGLAVFYPIFFLFLSWCFGGNDMLGGVPLLPPDMPPWQRWMYLLALVTLLYLAYRGGKAFIDSRIVPGAFALAGAGAVAVAVAFAGAAAGAGSVASAVTAVGAVTAVFAGTVAIVSAVAVAGTVAVFAERYPVNIAIWGSVALTLPIALLLLFAHDGQSSAITLGSEQAMILLFLALLPALNAILDWVSLGVSRYLLGRLAGPDGHSPLLIVGDILLAVVFFFLVSWVAIAGLGAAERLHLLGGAAPVFDVSAILDAIRRDSLAADHMWIYLMVGTTLLPTLAHFYFALKLLMRGGSGKERRAIIEQLKAGRGIGQDASTDAADDAARAYARLEVRRTINVDMLIVGGIAFIVVAWCFHPPFGDTIRPVIEGTRDFILDIGDYILRWIENDWNGWPFIWEPATGNVEPATQGTTL